MSYKKLICVALFSYQIFMSTSCATSQNVASSLNLSQVEKIDFANLSIENAVQKIGTPTLKDFIDSNKSEEGWIYLDGQPATTRLSLVFNTSSGKLVSAHWFLNENDPEARLSALLERFPGAAIDLHAPIKKDGPDGPTLFYSSKNSPLRVAVDQKSNLVSSISWRLAPSAIPDKRRPTSH